MKKIIAIAALAVAVSGQAQTVNYSEVKDVNRTRQQVTVTHTDGSVETFNRTNTGKVPFGKQFGQVVNGEHNAYDPSFHDAEGILRRGWYAGFSGEALWNISNSNFIGGPQANLGVWFGRWTIEAQLLYLFNNAYPMDGSAAGDHYNSLGAYLLLGYDLWSSDRYDQRVSFMFGGGYQHQMTDYRNAQFESANYGLGLVGELRYNKSFGRWNLFVGPEVRALPQVKATGGSQQFKSAAGIHLGFTFRGNKK